MYGVKNAFNNQWLKEKPKGKIWEHRWTIHPTYPFLSLANAEEALDKVKNKDCSIVRKPN